MCSKVEIDLGFNWNVGKVNLNEIVYRVDQKVREMVCRIIVALIEEYQEVVVNRLCRPHRTEDRAGLGRHRQKDDPTRLCKGRRVLRRGYRKRSRCIQSKYGLLRFRLREVECLSCGARFSPLLDALDIEPYQRSDDMLEKEVLSAVIDTNYRRLIEGHSIDVSLGGIHNYIAGSDLDEMLEADLKLDDFTGLLADGTGFKKKRGNRGEIRVLVGITKEGALTPIGTWVDTPWCEIDQQVRARIKQDPDQLPLFLYDGEPGLSNFLSGYVFDHQRCTWHAPRGLYHAMWEDGHGKKESAPLQKQLAKIVAVEIPGEDYDRLSPEDIEAVQKVYDKGKQELNNLIEVLHEKGCPHAVEYLKNLLTGLYHQVDLWLSTGIIAPKSTSRLERLFRELGRRLKKIAYGWSDIVATKLSKMILIKRYKPWDWWRYWLRKMGIEGNFELWIQKVAVSEMP